MLQRIEAETSQWVHGSQCLVLKTLNSGFWSEVVSRIRSSAGGGSEVIGGKITSGLKYWEISWGWDFESMGKSIQSSDKDIGEISFTGARKMVEDTEHWGRI